MCGMSCWKGQRWMVQRCFPRFVRRLFPLMRVSPSRHWTEGEVAHHGHATGSPPPGWVPRENFSWVSSPGELILSEFSGRTSPGWASKGETTSYKLIRTELFQTKMSIFWNQDIYMTLKLWSHILWNSEQKRPLHNVRTWLNRNIFFFIYIYI